MEPFLLPEIDRLMRFVTEEQNTFWNERSDPKFRLYNLGKVVSQEENPTHQSSSTDNAMQFEKVRNFQNRNSSSTQQSNDTTLDESLNDETSKLPSRLYKNCEPGTFHIPFINTTCSSSELHPEVVQTLDRNFDYPTKISDHSLNSPNRLCTQIVEPSESSSNPISNTWTSALNHHTDSFSNVCDVNNHSEDSGHTELSNTKPISLSASTMILIEKCSYEMVKKNDSPKTAAPHMYFLLDKEEKEIEDEICEIHEETQLKPIPEQSREEDECLAEVTLTESLPSLFIEKRDIAKVITDDSSKNEAIPQEMVQNNSKDIKLVSAVNFDQEIGYQNKKNVENNWPKLPAGIHQGLENRRAKSTLELASAKSKPLTRTSSSIKLLPRIKEQRPMASKPVNDISYLRAVTNERTTKRKAWNLKDSEFPSLPPPTHRVAPERNRTQSWRKKDWRKSDKISFQSVIEKKRLELEIKVLLNTEPRQLEPQEIVPEKEKSKMKRPSQIETKSELGWTTVLPHSRRKKRTNVVKEKSSVASFVIKKFTPSFSKFSNKRKIPVKAFSKSIVSGEGSAIPKKQISVMNFNSNSNLINTPQRSQLPNPVSIRDILSPRSYADTLIRCSEKNNDDDLSLIHRGNMELGRGYIKVREWNPLICNEINFPSLPPPAHPLPDPPVKKCISPSRVVKNKWETCSLLSVIAQSAENHGEHQNTPDEKNQSQPKKKDVPNPVNKSIENRPFTRSILTGNSKIKSRPRPPPALIRFQHYPNLADASKTMTILKKRS